jgi:hypothetical protein
MQLGCRSGTWFRKEGDESREHNQPSAGPSAAQPLCASVNEMAELLDDAVHHDHDVFRVPSAQRDEDDRKYLAHDCFLFQTGRLTGSWPYQTPKGSKQWSGRGAVLPVRIVREGAQPLHGACAIFGFLLNRRLRLWHLGASSDDRGHVTTSVCSGSAIAPARFSRRPGTAPMTNRSRSA